MDITFITGNAAKAEQVSRHLSYPLKHQALDLPEIQSLDVREIVEQKAKAAFEIVQSPVLVEDTSLTFHALGRLPGPLIKWFFEELDNDGLARLLDGYNDRSATASVLFGLYDGNELTCYNSAVAGTIADSPRGDQLFGWDPIFVPEGCDKTWAEMTQAEQDMTSMRKIALQKLHDHLKTRS